MRGFDLAGSSHRVKTRMEQFRMEQLKKSEDDTISMIQRVPEGESLPGTMTWLQ